MDVVGGLIDGPGAFDNTAVRPDQDEVVDGHEMKWNSVARHPEMIQAFGVASRDVAVAEAPPAQRAEDSIGERETRQAVGTQLRGIVDLRFVGA